MGIGERRMDVRERVGERVGETGERVGGKEKENPFKTNKPRRRKGLLSES